MVKGLWADSSVVGGGFEAQCAKKLCMEKGCCGCRGVAGGFDSRQWWFSCTVAAATAAVAAAAAAAAAAASAASAAAATALF